MYDFILGHLSLKCSFDSNEMELITVDSIILINAMMFIEKMNNKYII